MAKLSIRNRNEGQFYKDGRRKPANWEYRFDTAKVDGKRKTVSKAGFPTKKEAEIAGTEALAQYNNAGQHFEPSSISVADYLDYWYDNYVMMNCKYHTQVSYRGIIDNHLKPALGQYRLSSLTPTIIQEYVNQKFVTKLKKTTLNGIIKVLVNALKYAVVPAQLLKTSPAEYIRYPKKETASKSEVNRTIISVEDIERMLERFPKGNAFRYAIMIGFYTGLRIGEVYALTWDDIDLKEQKLEVNKMIYKRNFGVDIRKAEAVKGKKEEKSRWYFGSPKTQKSNRTIHFGNELASELREWKKMQMENQLKYGEYYNVQYLKDEVDEKGFPIKRILQAESSLPVSLPTVNLIFRKENGEMYSQDSFKYASRVIHYDLGIKFNFHSLRHTHATMLIESGVSPKTVQDRLGHENIETTLQTYVHSTDEMEKSAVDIFEKAVKKKQFKVIKDA